MNKNLIISLYDHSTEWPAPFIKAGYPVMPWDGRIEGDILEGFTTLCIQIDEAIEAGYQVHGILAAPPCTEFTVSGARWWEEKAKQPLPEGECWGKLDYAIAYAHLVLHLVDLYRPKFWALENPAGRIEQQIPELKPFRRYSFHPCDFGDPYTKRTILWGDFNADLQKNPVEPTKKNYIRDLGSHSRAHKGSITPAGFARAFFEANKAA